VLKIIVQANPVKDSPDIGTEEAACEVLAMSVKPRHCLKSREVRTLVADLPYVALAL